jgi:hypothetical protein
MLSFWNIPVTPAKKNQKLCDIHFERWWVVWVVVPFEHQAVWYESVEEVGGMSHNLRSDQTVW